MAWTLPRGAQAFVFPENMGESLCIDETAPSNGELYTVVTNRAPRGGKGTIIAIIKGVSAGTVIETLMRIDEDNRLMVKELTMDMSNSMRLIAIHSSPNAIRTIAAFIYRNWPVTPCSRCASPTDGMQSKLRRTPWRRPNTYDWHTPPSFLQTVIRQGCCLHAVDTCFSSLHTDGRKARDKELKCSLRYTRI